MPLCPQITNTPVAVPIPVAITAVSYTSTTATYTASGHTFIAGDLVTISGLLPVGYNGNFTIISVSGSTSFTVSNNTNAPVTDQSGTASPTNYIVNGVVPVIPATTTEVNAAQAAADAAAAAAASAQSTANTANSTANTAKTTADNAAILANNASIAATTAQTTANGAQTTANGKNTVKYSLSTPSGGGTNGDIWFQFDGSNNIIGQWTYNGSSWIANQITSTVIANLDAGKITTGTLDATLVSIQSQPSSSDKIIFSGTNNSITFNVAGAARGHIVPMNVGGSSYGVLYHYGSTPNPNGTSYPQAYVGATAALIAGSSTNSLGSSSSGNDSIGNFTCYGDLFAAGHQTTANAANAFIFTTGGRIARSTASSERYKENIVDLADVPELDPKKLLDLPVRAFTYKEGELPETDDRYQQLIPGFIAEEVDAIYPIATDYVDGPESWNDRMIVPALLSLVQDLYKRIEKLENTTNS
jgi:hypothetical protein